MKKRTSDVMILNSSRMHDVLRAQEFNLFYKPKDLRSREACFSIVFSHLLTHQEKMKRCCVSMLSVVLVFYVFCGGDATNCFFGATFWS